MEPISPQTVEDTQQEFRGANPPQLKEQAEQLHESQPELLAFVQASANQLDGRAADLCVYLFLMICRMYEKSYGEDLSLARPEDIIESYKRNEERMEELMGEGEGFSADQSDQPQLTEYVSEVIGRADRNADDSEEKLGDGEKAFIFMVAQTVMDVLDEKAAQ